MSTIRTGTTEPIRVYAVDGNSAPLTGLTDLYVRIERASDGFLFDWNDLTFKGSGWTTLNQLLTEADATNLPGVYDVTGGFDTSTVTNLATDDRYTVYALQTPGTNARLPVPVSFDVGLWADEINDAHGKLPTNFIMGSSVQTDKDDEIDAILADTNEMQGKLPTNFIMGSSVQTDKDDEIDAILADTNEMQGKLPTNFIMGSSVQTDKDDEIDAILADTNEMQGKLPTNNIMGSSVKSDKDDEIDAIFGKLPTNFIMGSGVQTDKDDEIDSILSDTNAILVDTNEMQGKLPTNNIMGSSVKTDKDDEIDLILADTNEMQTKLPTNNIMGSGVKSNKDGTIDAILTDTNEVQSKLPTNNIMGSSVKSDKDDEIDAILADTNEVQGKLPTNFIMGSGVQADKDDEIDSILADTAVMQPLVSTNLDAAVSTRAVPGDAMDLIVNALDSGSLDTTAVAEIADGVWDEALSGHVIVGSAGEALGRVDVDVSTRAVAGDAMALVTNAVDAAAVAASGAAEISDAVWDELLSGHTIVGSAGEAQAFLDAAVSSRAAPGNQMALTSGAEGTLVDAVWDEPTAGHVAAGSTGKALTDASATTSPATIAAAVWDANTAAHTNPASMGLSQGRLDQTISSRASPGDAMDLVTDAVDAAAVATSGAQEIRDAILSDSTPFAGANVDAAITSRAAPGDAMDLVTDALDSGSLASSAVNELVDQTWRETLTDHSGVVGSTAEALSNAAASVSPGAIADAVWDEALSGHVVVGSAGEAQALVDVAVSTRAAPGAAMDLVSNAVDSAALAASGLTAIQNLILNDATPFAGARIDAAITTRAVAGDDMGLTAAAVDLILDEALSGHTTAGTVGKALNNVDAQVSTRAVPGDSMGVTAGAVASVADGVWDEPLAGHVSSGSAGRKLGDLTIPPTVGDIADGVWDEALAGHAGAGSAGEAQARLDADVTTRAAPGDDMGLISAAILAAADQVWEETLADHSGTGGSTAEALARTEAAQVAAAVWDASLASYDTGGTFGGAINACCATAAGASQVTVNIQDLSSNPVQGAQVDFYDATNTTFLTRHFTDINGQVVVAIDDGTYAVRIWASGYAFTVPETLLVLGDGSATFQGQSFLSPTAPSGPDKCVIYGQILDAGGSPVVGAEVDANAVTPQAGGGYIIGPQIASTITDAAGYFELELLRNIEVNFVIDDADINVIKTVPDAPNQWYTSWA